MFFHLVEYCSFDGLDIGKHEHLGSGLFLRLDFYDFTTRSKILISFDMEHVC